VSGFDTESDGIATAARVLRAAVDTTGTAMSTVDTSACANLGPGRLGPAAADLLEAAKQDLGEALDAVTEDARHLDATRADYTDLDERAAADLRRLAGD
jgi:hypothetical protein